MAADPVMQMSSSGWHMLHCRNSTVLGLGLGKWGVAEQADGKSREHAMR